MQAIIGSTSIISGIKLKNPQIQLSMKIKNRFTFMFIIIYLHTYILCIVNIVHFIVNIVNNKSLFILILVPEIILKWPEYYYLSIE